MEGILASKRSLKIHFKVVFMVGKKFCSHKSSPKTQHTTQNERTTCSWKWVVVDRLDLSLTIEWNVKERVKTVVQSAFFKWKCIWRHVLDRASTCCFIASLSDSLLSFRSQFRTQQKVTLHTHRREKYKVFLFLLERTTTICETMRGREIRGRKSQHKYFLIKITTSVQIKFCWSFRLFWCDKCGAQDH